MTRMTILVAALCGCAPTYDLERAAVFDLRSDSPHLCILPVWDVPEDAIYAVEDGEAVLRGTLFEGHEDAEAAPTPILRDGITVKLWQLSRDTLEPVMTLATTTTDAEGTFALDWTPTQAPIGIQIEDEIIQVLSTTVVERSSGGGTIVCAYWADANSKLLGVAPRGRAIWLNVKAIGELDAPTLLIDQVGLGVGGDERVASLEGTNYVDGFSHTRWIVAGNGPGTFEGQSLQFRAFSHPVGAPIGEAVEGRSSMLVAKK